MPSTGSKKKKAKKPTPRRTMNVRCLQCQYRPSAKCASASSERGGEYDDESGSGGTQVDCTPPEEETQDARCRKSPLEYALEESTHVRVISCGPFGGSDDSHDDNDDGDWWFEWEPLYRFFFSPLPREDAEEMMADDTTYAVQNGCIVRGGEREGGGRLCFSLRKVSALVSAFPFPYSAEELRVQTQWHLLHSVLVSRAPFREVVAIDRSMIMMTAETETAGTSVSRKIHKRAVMQYEFKTSW